MKDLHVLILKKTFSWQIKIDKTWANDSFPLRIKELPSPQTFNFSDVDMHLYVCWFTDKYAGGYILLQFLSVSSCFKGINMEPAILYGHSFVVVIATIKVTWNSKLKFWFSFLSFLFLLKHWHKHFLFCNFVL